MKKAIILLSGGLDSATCLAIARKEGFACYALSFQYGQKQSSELIAAKNIATQANVASHQIVNLSLEQIAQSALTDSSIDIPDYEANTEIPSTYVPARNTIFLSIALGFAETVNADAIFIGANAVDYSGYPDCRPEYIHAFQTMANLATKRGIEGNPFEIKTPLISLTKSAIIERGVSLGVDYSQTVSCYRATAEGLACGSCDSCHFRQQGFKEAGIADPTRYIEGFTA